MCNILAFVLQPSEYVSMDISVSIDSLFIVIIGYNLFFSSMMHLQANWLASNVYYFIKFTNGGFASFQKLFTIAVLKFVMFCSYWLFIVNIGPF